MSNSSSSSDEIEKLKSIINDLETNPIWIKNNPRKVVEKHIKDFKKKLFNLESSIIKEELYERKRSGNQQPK